MAACSQDVAPSPTPTPSADDDGDGITNDDEGTETLCRVGTCTRIKTQKDKSTLQSLAYEIYKDAKRAKVTAGVSCNIQHTPNPSDNRPTTDDYLSVLQSAINKLPKRISRCE